MSRKIKYDIDAYHFLMDLNSNPGAGYAAVIKKIHAIAKNPTLRGSTHVRFDMDVELKAGTETLLFHAMPVCGNQEFYHHLHLVRQRRKHDLHHGYSRPYGRDKIKAKQQKTPVPATELAASE